MKFQPFMLSMNGIELQRPGRFSMNASYLQIASTGVVDAAYRLFALCQDMLLNRGAASVVMPALDALQPEVLAEKLVPQLGTLQKLHDPGFDFQEQENCLDAFQEVQANLPTDLVRSVTALAKAVIVKEMDVTRLGIRNIYATAPSTVQPLADTIRAALDNTRIPDANGKALTRWANFKRINDKLQQRRSILPASTVKVVQEVLASETHNLYLQSLKALSIEKIGMAWQAAKTEMIGYLGDIKKGSMEVVAALSEVKKILEGRRAMIAADQQVSRASVVKPLQGPTDAQVIAGMLTQMRAADELDLAQVVVSLWEARLRQICPQVCAWIDRNAALPDLLRAIPAEVQAAEFLSVIEEAQGPGQSLYEIIDREGVYECAEFLYHRSEPTVHLAGRDRPELGLSPRTFCIVTLPKPAGPKDGPIHDRLMAAFEKLDPAHATFADAAASDRTVTVIRILDGFVIGIEGQNANLLNHYLYAADQGHLPHLFGILPESPEGKALDSYRELKHGRLQPVPESAFRTTSFPSPLRKEQSNGYKQA